MRLTDGRNLTKAKGSKTLPLTFLLWSFLNYSNAYRYTYHLLTFIKLTYVFTCGPSFCFLWNLFAYVNYSVLTSNVLRYACHTAKNTVISPNFLVWKFCGKAQFRESPETMQKQCLSTKFPHQNIRWNYSILRSVICIDQIERMSPWENSYYDNIWVVSV